MSFIDQPTEVIFQQLRSLPIRDLLSACQTNPRLAEICQTTTLWNYRLTDDFKVSDPTRVADPRAYYFQLLEDRRYILEFILSKITREWYEGNLTIELFNGVVGYDEFVALQTELTSTLSEEDIGKANTIGSMLGDLYLADLANETAHVPNVFFYDSLNRLFLNLIEVY